MYIHKNKTKMLEIKSILIAHELRKTKNYLELQNKEKIITQNFGNVGEYYVVGNFQSEILYEKD